MYARCPHCETVFAIAAAHLRAAHGEVKCGRCQRVFDAIPHLTDGIEELPEPAPSVEHDSHHAVDAYGPTEPAEPAAPAEPTERTGRTEPTERVETAEARDDRPPDEQPAQVLEAGPDAGAPRSELAPRALHGDDPPPAEDPIPAVLRDDLVPRPAPPGRVRRLTWRLAALALLAALAAQYAWFEPRRLLASYPQARAPLERWCEWTGCDLGDGRDPASMRVVTRDVRVHPRYEGALQVNAVLVNTASFAQPFPRVRFSLFDVNGETVAARTFEPAEYLGAPPAPGAMLAPRVPVQIGLDLLAPEEISVSFEFRFL